MTKATTQITANPTTVERRSLWFGMFGGALAWVVHLIGAALTSEWGCIAGLNHWQWAGVSAVAWALAILSLIMLSIAVAATGVAYRNQQRLRPRDSQPVNDDVDTFLAEIGWKTSGLFVLIIAAQSIPIVFYLTEC